MTHRFLIRSISANLAALLLVAPVHAQTADALNQIKKIYVDTFTGKLGGPELQKRISNSVVTEAQTTDARWQKRRSRGRQADFSFSDR